VIDPLLRPTLSEILSHSFFRNEKIPSFLPSSTLACPPSEKYLSKFQQESTLCQHNKEIKISLEN